MHELVHRIARFGDWRACLSRGGAIPFLVDHLAKFTMVTHCVQPAAQRAARSGRRWQSSRKVHELHAMQLAWL